MLKLALRAFGRVFITYTQLLKTEIDMILLTAFSRELIGGYVSRDPFAKVSKSLGLTWGLKLYLKVYSILLDPGSDYRRETIMRNVNAAIRIHDALKFIWQH